MRALLSHAVDILLVVLVALVFRLLVFIHEKKAVANLHKGAFIQTLNYLTLTAWSVLFVLALLRIVALCLRRCCPSTLHRPIHLPARKAHSSSSIVTRRGRRLGDAVLHSCSAAVLSSPLTSGCFSHNIKARSDSYAAAPSTSLEHVPLDVFAYHVLPNLSRQDRLHLALTSRHLHAVVAGELRDVELTPPLLPVDIMASYLGLRHLKLRYRRPTLLELRPLLDALPRMRQLLEVTLIPDRPQDSFGLSAYCCAALAAALPPQLTSITFAIARDGLTLSELAHIQPDALTLALRLDAAYHTPRPFDDRISQLQAFHLQGGMETPSSSLHINHAPPLKLSADSTLRQGEFAALSALPLLSSLHLCLPLSSGVISPATLTAALSPLTRLTQLTFVGSATRSSAAAAANGAVVPAAPLSADAVTAIATALPQLASLTLDSALLDANALTAPAVASLAALSALSRLQFTCGVPTLTAEALSAAAAAATTAATAVRWVSTASLAPLHASTSLRSLVVHCLLLTHHDSPPLQQSLCLTVRVLSGASSLQSIFPGLAALCVTDSLFLSLDTLLATAPPMAWLLELDVRDVAPSCDPQPLCLPDHAVRFGSESGVLCSWIQRQPVLRRLRVAGITSCPQMRALLAAAGAAGGGQLWELELRAAAPLPRRLAAVAAARAPRAHTVAAAMFGIVSDSCIERVLQAWGMAAFDYTALPVVHTLVLVGHMWGPINVRAFVENVPMPALRNLHVGVAGGQVSNRLMRRLVERFAPAGVTVQAVTNV